MALRSIALLVPCLLISAIVSVYLYPETSTPPEVYAAPAMPVKVEPGKGLRVIIAGLSKTGTVSMQNALTKLGLNTYHFLQHMTITHDFYHHLYSGRLTNPDFRGLYANLTVDAVADLPAAIFAADLASAFPDAKVILMRRDKSKWLRSVKQHGDAIRIFRVVPMVTFASQAVRLGSFLQWLGVDDPGIEGMALKSGEVSVDDTSFSVRDLERLGSVYSMVDRYNAHVYGSSAFNPWIYGERFDEYTDKIRRAVPASRLLEFEVGQHGWKELCGFLALDAPDPSVPFPRANEAGKLKTVLEASLVWTMAKLLAADVVFLLLIVLLCCCSCSGQPKGKRD